MLKIIIGADICVTESNKEYFVSGDIEKLADEGLRSVLDESDVRIFNLEGPLTDEAAPIRKCGPNLRMPEQAINGLANLKPSLLTLANNHIMDHGVTGYQKTVSLLREAGIPYVGAGENLEEASGGCIIEKNGLKIGVYACAEHEFTIAGKETPGANPFDVLSSFDHIFNLKKQCDFLIVLYHGGKECYRYPSPEIQKVFRKMSEKGADLVIAQHTHCIGCMESYHNAELVYGQGNFIFDGADNEYWNTGMLLEICLDGENKRLRFYPFVKGKDGSVSLASGETAARLHREFRQRSEQILDEEFVRKNYMQYAEENLGNYLCVLHGNNFWFKAVNRLTGGKFVFRQYRNPRSVRNLLNYVECEAHRELMIAALKSHYKS